MKISTTISESSSIPDFSSSGDLVRLFSEGERLAYGHLANPAFAAEISLIDPLPHQRIAVYEHMLPQPRLRFLLADDAGAGKTIMAGLYIREVLARRLVRRILIVPPAGLVGNWERELRTLFSLHFNLIRGSDARLANPFVGPDSDVQIVSVDTLASDRSFRRLQEPEVDPYDLVIFDEAHKLSADREPDSRVRKTDRYRLAEALAGVRTDDPRWQLSWSCRKVLLLTATPHMGKDFPYYCLWRLLEPEALSTVDAFNAYPADARHRHFIRRSKEEMVRYDGQPIYPARVSDTLSYNLTQGPVSEQTLYDETTRYINLFYNRARFLNRSAARFAMSIFQRRMASSTYALLRSLERRLARLDGLISNVLSGRLTPEQLAAVQRQLEDEEDVLERMTGDEETPIDGREQNEVNEDRALGAVVSTSLADLRAEREQVSALCILAKQVYEQGDEAKFERLREAIRDPRFQGEKMIIFTEHRDTLEYLVRRLEGLGFTGQVARIHGGMDFTEREEQSDFFHKPVAEGGASYLVATDAAGEGINLQFCWLMVNYDIPWNPARLEQRMGRIHRYGQKHDPVIILNLIAGKTREGKVLRVLLDKLELIRRELGSDKVFDVVGRLFEGVSLRSYMEQALSDDTVDQAIRGIEGHLTPQQVQALDSREQLLYGQGGDVRQSLPALRQDIEREVYRRLLPGYIRRFIEKAAPLVGAQVTGDLGGCFSLTPTHPGGLDWLWPALEVYPPEKRQCLTILHPVDSQEAVFMRPGEPLFDRFRALVCDRLAIPAQQGAVFVDALATQPYLFHLALVSVARQGDARRSAQDGLVELRLMGLRQDVDGSGGIEECPLEHLLLLNAGTGERVEPALRLRIPMLMAEARTFLEQWAQRLAEQHRHNEQASLPAREDFVWRGYDYQEAELALVRARYSERAAAGDAHARAEVARIRAQQRRLSDQREAALALLRSEIECIAPGEATFLAHALAVPSNAPDDRQHSDEMVEALAVQVAWAYEEARGAQVKDVSKPALARLAGLPDWPGFDMLSIYNTPGQAIGGVTGVERVMERAIEVKGRAGIGAVELKENEWIKACNLRERYWLYVVYDCATPRPLLLRIQDPFGQLIVRAKGGVIINQTEIFNCAEEDKLAQ